MKKSSVSISDIARELGISASTVSRALNNNTAISERVTEKVKSKAIEMHYVPNNGAKNLKKGKHNAIGVIVPIISRNFFASAIEGIEDYANSQNYDVIICQSKESSTIEQKIVNSLKGKVDGIISSLSAENTSKAYYNTLSDINLPLVLFDRVDDSVKASKVYVDDYKGAKQAVEHLLDLGHKRIFHYSGPRNIALWNSRYRGYIDALKEREIEPEAEWVFTDLPTKKGGEAFANDLIEKGKELPTAIFFTGDYAALGALLVFKKHNIKVPEDIAIMGFANEPICDFITPSLSSVEQFSKKIGSIACKVLFEKMSGTSPEDVIIEPELIIRESSNLNINE